MAINQLKYTNTNASPLWADMFGPIGTAAYNITHVDNTEEVWKAQINEDKEAFNSAAETVKDTLTSIGNAGASLGKKIEETVGNIGSGMKEEFKEAAGEVKSELNFLAVLLVGGVVLTAWALSRSQVGKNVTVKAV